KYFGGEKFIVISPDEGSSYFTERSQGISLKKKRKRTSHGLETEIDSMEGHVDAHNKNICILDDIVATGGTTIHAIKHLRSLGAKKIIVGATHGVFAGDKIAEKILTSGCDHIFVTNAI